jgi:hypothetical protein
VPGPDHQFVVAEYPQGDTPLAGATARFPGCTVDLLSQPFVEERGERLHPSVVLVKGLPAPDLSALLARLAKVYDSLETVERDDVRQVWLGRMRLKESVYMRNPGAAVITQFQHRFGAPWCHIENGVMYVRARVNDPAHGDLLADQMRRFFAKAGVDAQVEVREIAPKDYGVWDDLVQRAIGLSS